MQKEVIEYLKEERNPYRLKVENMIVELEYSKNDKKFNECMLNILKQKRADSCNWTRYTI